jgi:hypothetical protein
MDAATITLAQLMGPVLFAVGVGIFVSREYYLKVYRELERETLAVMMGGIVALVSGIAVVLFHNTWGSLPQILVSLFGWLMVLKGLALLIIPKSVNRFGETMMSSNFFTGGAAVALLAGAYLSWVGFFV